VMVSAALDDASLTQTLTEVARDPTTIWTPGLEGNTASQLLAMVDCGALIAAAAYFLRHSALGGEQTAAPADQANRISRRREMLRALMLGQIAFMFGTSWILAVSFWSSADGSEKVATASGVAAAALLLVSAGLGARFWWLAGRADIPAFDRLALSAGMTVLLWLCAAAFAAAVVLTLAGQFAVQMGEILAYVLLLAAPILVVSYGFFEAVLALTRFRSSARSSTG
jgi:hypothetical protein